MPPNARRASLRATTPQTPQTPRTIVMAVLATVHAARAATLNAATPAALLSRIARLTSSLSARAQAAAAAVAVVAVAVAVAAAAVAAAAAGSPASPAGAASGSQHAQAPVAASVAVGQHHATRHPHPARHHVVATPAARHPAPAARHAAPAVRPAVRPAAPAVRHAAPAAPARRHHHHQQQPVPALDNWHAITEAAAGHPGGGALAPAQRLLPAALAGGQAALPITPARAANAQLITGQALRLHMGIRSAVIAVATAMQESTLENLNYGDRDSLGLFQQRPSAGWGTPAEITNPVYAADAFLHALAGYQAAHPGWATQPLYAAAQGVQGSAFPYAYAQWESQAAHIVAQATRHLL